ncbi:MAG: hypothetical protein ABR912_13410 [Terracidiphilus sp.]
MNVSWKSVDGRWMLLLILLFAVGGFCIRGAMQYASATSTERNATTYNASMHMRYHNFYFVRLSKYYTCSYDFMVEGVSYSGYGDCTQLTVDGSIKGKFSDSVQVLPIQNITVYYDPANPSLNSPTEFSARSKAEYRNAMLPMGVIVIIVVLAVMAMMLEATKSRETDWIFVHGKGTAIHPEEIGFDTGFGGLPGGSRTAEESYAAANGGETKATDFASSWGLRELYLDVVKQIHPDHASNEADRVLRERLTKEANAAYERGDDATLRRVLEEYTSMISATCQNTI